MKINLLPFQPHFFSFGGFELQTLNTFEGMRKVGLDVNFTNIWDRKSDFDILHFWGWGLPHCKNIDFAFKANKKTVATCLFSDFDGPKNRIKYHLKIKSAQTKIISSYYQKVDAIVVLNDGQAEICEHYFGINHSKIHVVPSVIHDIFFENKGSLFFEQYGIKDYILTTGNICKRKNQLNLAKACIKNGLKLVIIGKILDGEEAYGNELKQIVKNEPKTLWIPGLEPNSDMMMSAYSNASAFALPSFSETQPLSALEAASMRKSVLLGSSKYANQEYYKNCVQVIPSSIESISNGLQSLLQNKQDHLVPMEIIELCRDINVGKAYGEVYASIL
jgi:glycosyltransferase involved in cell wall biosynthesis